MFSHDDVEEEIDIERQLEEELQLELQKLDDIFHPHDSSPLDDKNDDNNINNRNTDNNDDNNNNDNSYSNNVNSNSNNATPQSNNKSNNHNYTLRQKSFLLSPNSFNVYEMAAVEGEREQLQDRMHLLLERVDALSQMNAEMARTNLELEAENRKLNNKVLDLELQSKSDFREGEIENDSPNSKERKTGVRDVEFKLAETRSKLARCQQANEDFAIGKEQLTRELDYERTLRKQAEKERDAYSSAYESCLRHLEKWAKAKNCKLVLQTNEVGNTAPREIGQIR